eukprot:gene14112-19044_t
MVAHAPDATRTASAAPAGLDAPRMVSGASLPGGEEAVERALRPKLLDDYVGQAKVRE